MRAGLTDLIGYKYELITNALSVQVQPDTVRTHGMSDLCLIRLSFYKIGKYVAQDLFHVVREQGGP